jgi:folate-binding protein YgfZ
VSLAGWSLVELAGADAASFLQAFCTNDVVHLPVLGSCEAFVCNVKGHVLGHVRIHRRQEQRFWVDAPEQQAEVLLRHWDKYLIREQVVLRDLSASHHVWCIVGPQATEAVSRLAGELRGEVLPSTFPHPGSYLAVIAQDQCGSLPALLASAQLALCDVAALEIVRVEKGYPLYGRDISLENLPQEVDRNDTAIHFRKGCYLGQETVARIDALGHVNQLLRQVRLSTLLPAGTELTAGGKCVGSVTSSVYSPAYGQALALAYVRRSHAAGGTELDQGVVVPQST